MNSCSNLSAPPSNIVRSPSSARPASCERVLPCDWRIPRGCDRGFTLTLQTCKFPRSGGSGRAEASHLQITQEFFARAARMSGLGQSSQSWVEVPAMGAGAEQGRTQRGPATGRVPPDFRAIGGGVRGSGRGPSGRSPGGLRLSRWPVRGRRSSSESGLFAQGTLGIARWRCRIP